LIDCWGGGSGNYRTWIWYGALTVPLATTYIAYAGKQPDKRFLIDGDDLASERRQASEHGVPVLCLVTLIALILLTALSLACGLIDDDETSDSVSIPESDRGEYACARVPDDWAELLGAPLQKIAARGRLDQAIPARVSQCNVIGANAEAQLFALDYGTRQPSQDVILRAVDAYDLPSSGFGPDDPIGWGFKVFGISLTTAEHQQLSLSLNARIDALTPPGDHK
jgi:hypothetical protein